MRIQRIIGWLLVTFCLTEALMTTYDAFFTDNRLGTPWVIVSLLMFVTGAVLIERSKTAKVSRKEDQLSGTAFYKSLAEARPPEPFKVRVEDTSRAGQRIQADGRK
jgi:hypothetical protein